MKFFRKDRLFVPEDTGEVKGRSMVGYSRRTFFGLAAAALTAQSVADQFEFVTGQMPRPGEVPMGPTLAQTFENFADAVGFRFLPGMLPGDTVEFGVETAEPVFQVGQIVELNLTGYKPSRVRITQATFSAKPNENVQIRIQSEVIG